MSVMFRITMQISKLLTEFLLDKGNSTNFADKTLSTNYCQFFRYGNDRDGVTIRIQECLAKVVPSRDDDNNKSFIIIIIIIIISLLGLAARSWVNAMDAVYILQEQQPCESLWFPTACNYNYGYYLYYFNCVNTIWKSLEIGRKYKSGIIISRCSQKQGDYR